MNIADKILMNAVFGKTAVRAPVLSRVRVALPDSAKAGYWGPNTTVTPEGHVFRKSYGPKSYCCMFCGLRKQTKRGRAEYLSPSTSREGKLSAYDARWSSAIPRCVAIYKETP